MNFKKQDRETLQKYETNFRTALMHNYTRNIPSRELDALLNIYERSTSKKYVLCKHCSTSILNFIKVLGRMYNEDMEITNKKKKKQDNG